MKLDRRWCRLEWYIFVCSWLAACSDRQAEPAPSANVATGKVGVALETVGSEGNRYRLSRGDFAIDGPESEEFSAEDYLGQDVARFVLPVGSYGIALDDWRLQRREGSTYRNVSADLISDNPEDFLVLEGETTRVNFQFLVDDEIVGPGEGEVEVGIGVTERTPGDGGTTDDGSPGPRCGNDTIDPGEECDDGNSLNTDLCTNTCAFARCGDGWLWRNVEDCDDGNAEDGDTCGANCIWECGNGVVDPGEGCDDANSNEDDNCSSSCATPTCGDGHVDPGEECDDGNANGFGGDCTFWCTLPACGDGSTDDDEECDDGNAFQDDSCLSNCAWNQCGDGEVYVTVTDSFSPYSLEACDDGNSSNNDECSNACELNGCGNGIVEPGEQCDDGQLADAGIDGGIGPDNDSCTSTCRWNSCGDGIPYLVQTDTASPYSLEECDDGNSSDGDECSNACELNICGNGVVEPGEQCDDGQLADAEMDSGIGPDNNSCTSACRWNSCGDGIPYLVQTDTASPYSLEECDDGNSNESDLCSAGCTLICPDDPKDEYCWPSGGECGYADQDCVCNECGGWTCTPKCGNGVIDGAEECDDGNLNPCDGCLPTCVASDAETAPAIAPTVITSDAVWCGDVAVNANLVIMPTATLFVGPGTISIGPNVTIQVRGHIRVGGTDTDSAVFSSQFEGVEGGVTNDNRWYGIDVVRNLGATAQLEHVQLEHADRALSSLGVGSALRHAVVSHNGVGILTANGASACDPLRIDDVLFVGNEAGAGNYWQETINYTAFTHCSFVDNETGLSYVFSSTTDACTFSNNGIGIANVYDNTITDCILEHNLRGIENFGGGTLLDSSFTDNGTALWSAYGVTLERNLITNSTEAGIRYLSDSTFTDNTIVHNALGVTAADNVTLTGNTLCDNGSYDLVSQTLASVIAEDNWWCTTDGDVIADRIRDVFDGDPNAGPVFYEPFLLGPSDDAPPDPSSP